MCGGLGLPNEQCSLAVLWFVNVCGVAIVPNTKRKEKKNTLMTLNEYFLIINSLKIGQHDLRGGGQGFPMDIQTCTLWIYEILLLWKNEVYLFGLYLFYKLFNSLLCLNVIQNYLSFQFVYSHVFFIYTI